jgi:hypothetical protein
LSNGTQVTLHISQGLNLFCSLLCWEALQEHHALSDGTQVTLHISQGLNLFCSLLCWGVQPVSGQRQSI